MFDNIIDEKRTEIQALPEIWVVGVGPMAIDYSNVLRGQNYSTKFIGRSKESVTNFAEKTNLEALSGGLTGFLSKQPKLPYAAIVVVGIESLASVSMELIEYGVKNILLEKPGALSLLELKKLHSLAKSQKCRVQIAYNRRFFSSTILAKKFIDDDGGLSSMHFEFTEWGHVISNLEKAEGVKEKWLIGNSSHVIDLAFYIGGDPDILNCFTAGALSWHKASSVFAGAGETSKGALFSYMANWESSGRWSLEFLTKKRRLIFRPMEYLKVINKGSISEEEIPLDDKLDKNYKPGIYLQVKAFLNEEYSEMCSLEQQILNWSTYSKIAGYI